MIKAHDNIEEEIKLLCFNLNLLHLSVKPQKLEDNRNLRWLLISLNMVITNLVIAAA